MVVIFAGNFSFAGDRTILVERFTSSTCPPCASNNPIMDAYLGSQDPTKITGISYHMDWPAPGNDPMHHHNVADNTGRRNYYGVSGIPTARFEGSTIVNAPYSSSTMASLYTTRQNSLSPITVIVRTAKVGDSVTVYTTVYTETLIADPSATLRIAVMERLIQYPSPPGTNGESSFHDVMRKMLPNANGIPVILMPGHTITMEHKFKLDPAWEEDEIEVIAFVQNGAKEIYNTGFVTEDFNLLTSLGYKVVNQGQPQDATFNIQIPYTAPGYNSTVTFTAQEENSTPGITTSFPNGNTVGTFPGNVNVKVNSNASVPAGVYKIVVTGTSASGDVHKIVVNYLVGKSWITAGVFKSQVIYKVDGVDYSGLKLFTWDVGSNHTIEAVTPQTFINTRYVFQNWLNTSNTNPVLNVTVNTTESDYIAMFKTQFKVTTSVLPAGIPVTVNGGNQFYDSSSANTISVSPTTVLFNGRNYYFQRWLGGGIGSYTGSNPSFQISLTNPVNQVAIYDTISTGIANYSSEVPDRYALHQNYPNPFNPVTKIRFDIKDAGNVKLTVFNSIGERVAVLYDGFLTYGKFEMDFNASQLSSGIYFYRLETDNFTDLKKLVVLK